MAAAKFELPLGNTPDGCSEHVYKNARHKILNR